MRMRISTGNSAPNAEPAPPEYRLPLTSPLAPILLAPAGSLDAVRAAIANGANAVYLGVERFNARDEGAQLTMEELDQACVVARQHNVRVYLTLNVLLKDSELRDALNLLGEAIDRGIDAVIVQDLGFIRLIQKVYPGLEIHGSTQMTVHDTSGMRLARDLGIDRVVMARENTVADLRTIRAEMPDAGLETFVHGAVCISYSGQCLMSGMISERSANRGSCAQACRKDYRLRDDTSGEILDRGFLISARDLAAYDVLPDLVDIGVACFKIEGRKKKPEYVAVTTERYREFISEVGRGRGGHVDPEQIQPLVQIYSRGFTTGMFRGRGGRNYVTRTQPDNRGTDIGLVTGFDGGEVHVEVNRAIKAGDGIAFEPPAGSPGSTFGFSVARVRTISQRPMVRQALAARHGVPPGWRVVLSSEASLMERARESFRNLDVQGTRRIRLDISLSGRQGTHLTAVFESEGDRVTVKSEIALTTAAMHVLDEQRLRQQLGRLGNTPFTLGKLNCDRVEEGLFLPVSELNRLRREAVDRLLDHREHRLEVRLRERSEAIDAAVSSVGPEQAGTVEPPRELPRLIAETYRLEDARAAVVAGATEVVFDPFLRHPVPPLSRVRALAQELRDGGIPLALRTPTIVRPEDRGGLDKWLDLGLPLLSGHVGLACELSGTGHEVVADYAVNCFNSHTASELFSRGIRRISLSVELTVNEIENLVQPWKGSGFDVVVYGRPEGMTMEHCVLSAAFDREPTTCRDLCVRSHPLVSLTDPAGYAFPLATDTDCRNRLLHSRPIEGSEFIPRLWQNGIRGYRAIFNVPGDDVPGLIGAYRRVLDALVSGVGPSIDEPRSIVGGAFTRGHFQRAV